MADIVQQLDLLDLTAGAPASAFVYAVAGAASNNASAVGVTLDRYQFGMPLTAVFGLASQATLGANNTLSVNTVVMQHSADGATWTTYQPGATPVVTAPGVVSTGPTGGGTVLALNRFGVDLRMAQRYVRLNFTPTLSAANTDTANLVALATFGGFDRLPPQPGLLA